MLSNVEFLYPFSNFLVLLTWLSYLIFSRTKKLPPFLWVFGGGQVDSRFVLFAVGTTTLLQLSIVANQLGVDGFGSELGQHQSKSQWIKSAKHLQIVVTALAVGLLLQLALIQSILPFEKIRQDYHICHIVVLYWSACAKMINQSNCL